MEPLKSKIESLLFAAGRPLTAAKIANLVGVKQDAARKVLGELQEEYASRAGGTRLLESGGDWQVGSAPENADVVGKFLQEELSGELTRPQLETLTIVAYRGPISKTELEQIRGVNCALILRNLAMRGLVESDPSSRERRDEEDKVAKLARYRITLEFLRHMGLSKIEDLPDYERLHTHQVLMQAASSDQQKL